MAEGDMAQGKKVWGMDMGMDRNRDAVYQTVSHRTDSHQTGTGDGKETAGKWNIGNRNAGSKTTGLRRRILRSWQLYVLLLPAVVYIAVFAYKPMYGILIAFKDFSIKKGVWGSPWVGFDNFTRLFKSYWFPVILRNTLTISLLNLVLGFPFPILLALLLNEVKNNRFRSAVQTISYAPHFISTVVMCGMLMLFLSPTNGIVNKLLNLLGQESVFFMQEAGLFKWVYVLSGIWQGVGWSSIIYYAALSGVDRALLEAAEIDGATRLQKIWYINLPEIMPTVLTMLILSCGNVLSVGYEKARSVDPSGCP